MKLEFFKAIILFELPGNLPPVQHLQQSFHRSKVCLRLELSLKKPSVSARPLPNDIKCPLFIIPRCIIHLWYWTMMVYLQGWKYNYYQVDSAPVFAQPGSYIQGCSMGRSRDYFLPFGLMKLEAGLTEIWSTFSPWPRTYAATWHTYDSNNIFIFSVKVTWMPLPDCRHTRHIHFVDRTRVSSSCIKAGLYHHNFYNPLKFASIVKVEYSYCSKHSYC